VPDVKTPDGAVIHYDERGPADGPAVLLIEGLGAHMLGWRAGFCDFFAEAGYRVLRFDNRDVGLSQKYPSQSYALAEMADDAHYLLEVLDLAPAHIVGQSMGGMVAQHLVLRHPGDVASLMLLYTAASGRHVAGASRSIDSLRLAPRATSREEAIEYHIRLERVCASRDYSFDEAWKRELGGLMWDRCYDPDGVVRQREAVSGHAIDLADLAAITIPTLIIHGTSDNLISHEAARELHATIAGSELWLVEGLGHDLPRELWPELTRRIIGNARRWRERQPHPRCRPAT
jgi:pimeloyl-ACP methyl ester carboxylesterase